jgi:hypothetical protein
MTSSCELVLCWWIMNMHSLVTYQGSTCKVEVAMITWAKTLGF